MLQQKNGAEIVAEMAEGRAWWRLSAADIKPWSDMFTPSTLDPLENPTAWIGTPWDQKSDVTLRESTETIIKARKIENILHKIRKYLTESQISKINLPTEFDVRICFGKWCRHEMVVIDIDLIDFILPLGISSMAEVGPCAMDTSQIASKFVQFIKLADQKRAIISRKEVRFREALENTVSKLNTGASPLWLRRHPIPADADQSEFNDYCYAISYIELDQNLHWSPRSDGSIYTKKEITEYYSYFYKDQRKRAQRVSLLDAYNTEGLVSDVALALLVEHGISPRKALLNAKAAVLDGEQYEIGQSREKNRAIIYLQDGALEVHLAFDGGNYSSGNLTLFRAFPDTIVACLKGRRLGDIVGHPAFMASKAVARTVSTDFGQLNIRHDVKMHTIEEASQIYQQRRGRTNENERLTHAPTLKAAAV